MIYSSFLRGLFRAILGPMPDLPAEGAETGLVLVADGVGGLGFCGTSLRYMTARDVQGCGHCVKVVPWGHGFGRWYRDLTDVANLDVQAEAMAVQVKDFHARLPGKPAFLIGKSGGSGVVIRAMEHLPTDSIEAAVLIAPALSPGYDLGRALRAVRRELVVFWSPWDVFILGAGTRLFGTIDGVKAAGAGMVGFRRPEGLDESSQAQYAKLRQVRWSPAMATTGYLGGHFGPDSPAFLRKYVVPLLYATPLAENANPDGAASSQARAAPIT